MQPAFIDGPAGPLFTTYYPPENGVDYGDVIFVPPFAEELNRSRHMIAKTARTLAASGWGVLVLDLYGTGDSSGEFADARWDIWQKDILAARQWLLDQGRPAPGLWAMRTGCLLVHDLLTDELDWPHVLFWQPVPQGKTFLTQFLRVALAASMTTDGKASSTASTLRAELAAGNVLEIAGYQIHPDLATALEAATLSPIAGWTGHMHWLEVSNTAPEPSPGFKRAVSGWYEAGVSVNAQAIAGPQFWMLQEPEWAEALIVATQYILTADA